MLPSTVAQNLISKAIRTDFVKYFPDPGQLKKQKQNNAYQKLTDWFGMGNSLDLLNDISDKEYESELKKVMGLEELVVKYQPKAIGKEKIFLMEFALHGLVEYSLLNKNLLDQGIQFKDYLSTVFAVNDDFNEEDFMN